MTRIRWNTVRGERTESERVDAFIEEILDVCKRHDLSISHEDSQGAFIVEPYRCDLALWLRDAHDATDGSPPKRQRGSMLDKVKR